MAPAGVVAGAVTAGVAAAGVVAGMRADIGVAPAGVGAAAGVAADPIFTGTHTPTIPRITDLTTLHTEPCG
jgi:hypothetical protein